MFGVVVPGHATVLVSNIWNIAARSYPAYNDPNSPYSEMGVDYNSSGDFESAWFNASGTLTPSIGHLIGALPSNGTSSASWTTYFTTETNPVTLAGTGDQLKITWVFTPSGVNSSSTSSSGFRLAVVDSPSASRLTSDNSPGSSTYAGYGMFMNMATTLGSSSSFQLMERSAPGTSSAFLSSSGSWTTLTNGAGSGHTGYASGTQYTFVMTFSRNASGGLDITATMTGGSLNNTGSISVVYSDSTPSSFTFDTFGLRPSSANDSASSFDTSLFKVEFIPGATPPSIDFDPQDQSALVGQDTSFSVQASGTAPLSYQWYYNTNTLLTNATSSTLTLTNVQLSDSGGYSVVVTNGSGAITSAVAQLTVSLPVAPSIITQPQDQSNLLPGATATFSVIASGSDPLSYQWYYNTSTLLTNATDSILTITNVQSANGGGYSVVINNPAGSVTSSNAFLTVNTNPVAPVFISQPASLVVLHGSTVSFTAVAGGAATISYQWNKNGTPITGATSSTLNLSNVQTADDGSYTLTASNSVGTATCNPAQLTVTASIPQVNSAYNLVGFGQAATGGGMIPDTDPAYAKVTTPLGLANAVYSFNKTGGIKVIEIMNDLDLGWNEIGSAIQTMDSTPFNAAANPQLHPRLITTGVSKMDIKYKNGGLTIFSANGATIRHCTFNIKSTHNIIVRNLKFDEMWEWDEATKGQYDKNDWDFIDLANGGDVYNVWIDHCTFTKSYDGIVDMKAGSTNVTLSWCKYTGDDGATNTNSFVWQQINSLESNKTSHAFYYFLRNNGFSTTNIVQIIQGHDKTHLMGSNDKDPNNVKLSATFHHLWMHNCWDRAVPRLRAGNVHDFNNYVDDTDALAAKRLRDTVQRTMSQSSSNALKNTYSFSPPLNGSISTEGGAILVEKSVYIDCLTPLRNNQTDPSDPTYTGKILGLDMIYQMDSTVVRGNSTDPGSPLGPFQDKNIITFSWNTNSGAPGGQLPYTYTLDDPGQLQSIVTNPTNGAGAGALTWNKTNWLITSYPATAPIIIADPQGQTYTAGQYAAFSVAAGGSSPFRYQWYFNTNSAIPNATNTLLAIANVQVTNTGIYSVIVFNTAGSATSSYAPLVVTAANTAPTLTPVPDTNIIAGVTLNITNVATDPDLPLTFSLLSAPGNASLGAASGVFSWRPLISQAGTTNHITVKVTDNGTPNLSAIQSFNIIVSTPAQPQMPSFAYSNGQFNLVITGSIGPDYIVLTSTNLTDWAGVFTNPMPFTWTDTGASNFNQRFYRIQLGP
jgi:pectate lyase